MKSDEIQVGTQLDVHVDRLAFGGDVIAAAPDGRLVFLRGAAPGDSATIEVTQVKKRFMRGRVVSLRPGPAHVEPFCEHYNTCGGCPWQAAPRTAQRDAIESGIERSIVQAFEPRPRVAETWFDDAVEWRATTRLRWRGSSIGYFRPSSHVLVDIDHCPILVRPVDVALSAVRAELTQLDGAGTIRLTAGDEPSTATVVVDLEEAKALRQTADALGRLVNTASIHGAILRCPGNADALFGEPVNQLGAYGVSHPASAFVQAHQRGSRQMVRDVIEHLADAEHVLELYAGSGNFTFGLMAGGHRVTAVEIDRAAAARLKTASAERSTRGQVVVHCSRAEHAPRGDYDAVLLDPPRAGAKAVLPSIDKQSARRVVYVSCDQATLTRDLKWMKERGWSLTSIRSYDLFPHSGHAELVAVCDRGH